MKKIITILLMLAVCSSIYAGPTEKGLKESSWNSLQTSLEVLEIMDEILLLLAEPGQVAP